MRAVTAVCASAISALGRGRDAYFVGEPSGQPRTALSLVPAWSRALRNPWVGRVELDRAPEDSDHAEGLLLAVLDDLVAALDQLGCDWRRERVAVVLGTSAGSMLSIEKALAARERGTLTPECATRAPYFAPLRGIESALGARATIVQLLAACASSTLAIGLGCRWLEAGLFDWVIAGGYDALSGFVASGFDQLGALSPGQPRPFREDRDGMALGEGAALIALHSSDARIGVGRVLGFGASSDAVHITAPDATGAGLARAALAALEDAGLAPSAIDLVNAHGTATRFNDAAESQALLRIFASRRVPLFPFKAVIGHTLGASGALEALATWDALARGLIPAVPGRGALCSEGLLWLPEVHEPRCISTALKLSAAFGGANAALVLGRLDAPETGSSRSSRPVALAAQGSFTDRAEPELVCRLAPGQAPVLSRLDSLSELVLAAAARLLEGLPCLPDSRTAVVVGSASATLECNEQFDRRRRAGLQVEPRRFPATSPNVCAGWCSIAFGFLGPALSVGSGSDPRGEALAIGYDLVAYGDAEAALVIVAEDVGPVVNDLFGKAGFLVPPRGAEALLLVPALGGVALERGRLAWPTPVDAAHRPACGPKPSS